MPPTAAAKTIQPRLRHRSGDSLEGPFMCRLRTNFARLGDPMQGPHNGNAPLSPPTAVLLLKGSMSLDSQTSGRMPKGKRLYGQARRLLIRPCVFYAEYAPTVPTNPVPLPPRRGKFALRSASKLTSNSRHSAAKTSPSGGGAVGRRGAFPRASARLYGFSCRMAFIDDCLKCPAHQDSSLRLE